MTLDEAIKHCEEIAMDKTNLPQTLWDSKQTARCKESADEHNQLAQWLIELKILRNNDVLDKIRAEIHANAEMHDDGDYYLRDEWIDEIFDKYRNEVNP